VFFTAALCAAVSSFVTFYLSNLSIMTLVSVDSSLTSNNLVRVDVNVIDVPVNMFGVSFHLNVDGDWSLKNYEVGESFEGVDPLFMVGKKDNSLITGISLKRGDSFVVQDGTLVTYYLQVPDSVELSFGFKNTVLSVFDGMRKDISGVKWIGSENSFNFNDEVTVLTGEHLDIEIGPSTLESGVYVADNVFADVGGGARSISESSLYNIYYVLFVALLILIFSVLIFWFFHFSRNRG